jgi:hypothetical protein
VGWVGLDRDSRLRRLLPAAGVVLAAGGLATACGNAGSSTRTNRTGPPTHNAAVQAPAPRTLRPGDTLTITGKSLTTTGFQVSCVSHGQRANVETVPGQRVPVGTVIRYPAGGPVVVIVKKGDGSYRLSCQTS